ncbi:uncharacterized protein LOC120849365 [Ixodes scapularis]|uniref:uncharacterized protein LOC120849365 n=1 Tax=Ixodes scapularis TaxID=6945 RepID=UPI001A9DCDA7|nr:uncharacterized protein LOC120849365 [Ixodes scapularis]
MYRNISIMLLVLYAVVLILPAFQGEGFLSGTEQDFRCWHNVDPAGAILCQLHGSKGIFNYRPELCMVTCSDPDQTLTLAPKICPSGMPPCNETIKQGLLEWKEDMKKTKERLMKDWCPAYQGK